MDPVFEEGHASNILPIVDAAAFDHGEDTIEYDNEAALDLEAGSPPQVSLLESKKESEEFQDVEQNTMKGMLKMLLDNQKAFQKTQKNLQKKLDDQEKELTSLRNVSEEDSVDRYEG